MNRDRNSIQRKAGQPASSASASHGTHGGFAPDNPAMLAQRKQIESSFGSAAQLAGPEEELQMKAPDEELQMKAPDEELPAQGKLAG